MLSRQIQSTTDSVALEIRNKLLNNIVPIMKKDLGAMNEQYYKRAESNILAVLEGCNISVTELKKLQNEINSYIIQLEPAAADTVLSNAIKTNENPDIPPNLF